jgi:hypothetical protein
VGAGGVGRRRADGIVAQERAPRGRVVVDAAQVGGAGGARGEPAAQTAGEIVGAAAKKPRMSPGPVKCAMSKSRPAPSSPASTRVHITM